MNLPKLSDKFAAPEAIGADGRLELVGLSKTELETALSELGLPRFRTKQVWHWLYHQGARRFEDMTTLSKDLRTKLAESFSIYRPEVTADQQSVDGTRKWLLKMRDGHEVECVFIPEEDRGTLCISSQVGCMMSCKFCHTGTQKLVRNLGPAEYLAQVMHARDALDDWPSGREDARITNIVLMGMGEPLYNYDNMAKAMKIVLDGDGIAIGKRRITLSTCGVVPMIARCGEELNVNLAISLHAVTDELRSQIMPVNKQYPLDELIEACRNYPGVTNARRITFEYVMLKGLNDSDEDAHALCRLLRDIPAKINLIPFNPWPGSPYERSSNNRIQRFGDILAASGYSTPVRKARGEDILAACGQLKSASERARKQPDAEDLAKLAARQAVLSEASAE